MYYMRSVLNISLPKEMAQEIRREVKSGKFSSVSEFMRAAVRAYRVERLLRLVRKGEKEFAEGKTFISKSVRDLR